LLWVLGVLSVSLLVVFTTVGWLVALHAAQRRERARADAQVVAESAIHLALAELNRAPGYAGLATSEAVVNVQTPAGGAPPTSPWFSLDATDVADWRRLAATVRVGMATARAGGMAKAIYHPLFPAGLFASEGLDLRDLTTDSYDSRRGDYRASREFLHGDVGTFGTLRLGGACQIGGDARPGPGQTVVLPPGVKVMGRIHPYPVRFSHPLVEGPRDQLKPLKIPLRKTMTLAGGAYVVPDLQLPDTTRLLVQHPVTLYVGGNVRLPAHALITHSAKALDVTLYVAGVSVELWPPFRGALYAPQATVVIHGPGEIFGAITARTITTTGPLVVHADRSLPYLTRGPRVEFRLLGWDVEGIHPA
jgi:hypothetical protein